jgi:prepilin-type N-terminal cleavage/methylation domain-containing protein
MKMKKNGFTIVEFLVVIGILVVLLAMASMAGSRLFPDYSLVSTTNKLTSSLQLAKSKHRSWKRG